jgi:hypothetical protein
MIFYNVPRMSFFFLAFAFFKNKNKKIKKNGHITLGSN